MKRSSGKSIRRALMAATLILTAFCFVACRPATPDADGVETNEPKESRETESPTAAENETTAEEPDTPAGQDISEEPQETEEAPLPEGAFEYAPGTVTCRFSSLSKVYLEALSEEEQAALTEYFRLRGEQLTDPLNSMSAFYDSPVRLGSTLADLYEKRAASALAALYRIGADYEKVDVTLTINAVDEKDGEHIVTLDEFTEIGYRYKGHRALDRMSWSLPHTVVLQTDETAVIEMDYYDEELILPKEEDLEEEALEKVYESYLLRHPVTEEMRTEARNQIMEYLKARLQTAISAGSFGLQNFHEEDIPMILQGAKISYDPALSEKWVLIGVREQLYRLPFRKYKAVFSMTFDLVVEDPETKEGFQPFSPRFNRIFFVPEDGKWDYIDIHDYFYYD